ncbi:spore cortex biosynthesis protein YabQ [Caldibacillus lycopersici]|uniref:Spore cortex biosynthesis protein YabQ n=1 Tax=Perspicuibacillus lycopersici TaxID=1325689 RepID=A0AAE3IVD1_9BACI|nr:spore cortex biosynthesis protein YabQ [Perspicuibacillus lycopersici]MCU9615278.1 spore cortex biosynthesis protein YabQ [Perspicuibacillus lycopersici]
MSLTTQFYTMLAMIGMGSYLGAALDTYSRFLKRSKRKRWYVFINDILFWFLQGLFLFYVLFLVNNGEIRFYIFVALLCGFAAYQSLLKKLYNSILETLIQIMVNTFRFSVKLFSNIIVRPIAMLLTFLLSVLLFFWKLLLKLLQFLLKLLYWIWGVIASILAFIFHPLILFGKFLWNKLPKSFKMKGYTLFNNISNIIKWIINRFRKKNE